MFKFIKGFCFGGLFLYQKVILVNFVMFLFEYGWIMMIELKVWVLCLYVEKLIMYVKKGVLYNWCEVFKKFCDKDVVYILFVEIGLFFVDCDGGYICIIKIEVCKGDNVLMVVIELVWEKMVILEVN